ncbi:MAG: ribonucleoside-diphosphate reductase subunit alpha [Gammaproteobacteria bacterium]|nr:ribonucleoside-diphosphate reductase subunit alpha [Gammaproteobacteria bacterium]
MENHYHATVATARLASFETLNPQTPATPLTPAHTEYSVIRRNGKVTPFDASKIMVALTKAFLAVEGGHAAQSRRVHDCVTALVAQVMEALVRHRPAGGHIHIEDIQDHVELALMRAGEHKVARAYVLYRDERARQRASQAAPEAPPQLLQITLADGQRIALDEAQLQQRVAEACEGLADVHAELIVQKARPQFYDGMQARELVQALVLAARMLIETEPNYSFVTARLLLDNLRHEALGFVHGTPTLTTQPRSQQEYPEYFAAYVHKGVQLQLLDPRLTEFDLARLAAALVAQRDQQFTYLGLQTLYDRYFLHQGEIRFELPQAFFMRVAMGLAIHEIDRDARAIEFYNLLSRFDFMSSTPTLFNAGTLRPQLSSCYLTTVRDDLDSIYSCIKDNALLSKFAGGLGNDWTPVRALGAHIKGTNGKSQGVVPFLKVVNDTAVAVNQGGKRKGAVCAYLETWHLDIEEFLELRKNTGDERRRTHDMNTANWIPDLFMQRVRADAGWTLFSPQEVPELHDRVGKAFAQSYLAYEHLAEQGRIKNFKRLPALQLWRKMLSMLFETGHPWMAFKDPCNLRSPQQHVGVVHSSNLCTEITLNTSEQEIAVCNLGSINLANHVDAHGLNQEKLQASVCTAMRMLDNVIDINFYSVPQARHSNLRHRPVGLGLMGFQDALYQLQLPYESEQAVEFADYSMEAISYFALQASCDLAQERGRYSSFSGSLWSQGILPLDSLALLEQERGEPIEVDRQASGDFNWAELRERIKTHGLRNSNCMAIAPTATISNICGVAQSIEPTYQNLFVKSNLSGEFTVINPYLVSALKSRGLWDEVIINDLKYFDGSVQSIDRCPAEVKQLFKCAFEVDPAWLIKAAARRQKWLDQAQSLNLYINQPSGKKLDALYQLAWQSGLKTTYYLRSKSATHAEKSTVTDTALNAVPLCSIDNPECEVCQ